MDEQIFKFRSMKHANAYTKRIKKSIEELQQEIGMAHTRPLTPTALICTRETIKDLKLQNLNLL